jgi:hypothetical protein
VGRLYVLLGLALQLHGLPNKLGSISSSLSGGNRQRSQILSPCYMLSGLARRLFEPPAAVPLRVPVTREGDQT